MIKAPEIALGCFFYVRMDALNVPTLFWTAQILKEGYFPNRGTLCVHIRNLNEGYILKSHARGAHHTTRGLPYTHECSFSCGGASRCHVLLVHISPPKICPNCSKSAPGSRCCQIPEVEVSEIQKPDSRKQKSRVEIHQTGQ